MARSGVAGGYFRSGLPYNRFGQGRRILVVFQDLQFENKPLNRLLAPGMTSIYRFLNAEYTSYLVTRKPGLPDGYTLKDMADDYAVMIRQEFDGPVDVIGRSTGGSIAQHFAADHPELVRRLVLHSTAYTLGEAARQAQRHTAQLARERKWQAAYAAMLGLIVPRDRWFTRPAIWLGARLLSFGAPQDPSDLVITIEAEDKFDFKHRLAEITVPTLLIAGQRDPVYSETLFRETAEGIPNAGLILYPGKGHAVAGKQFERDVLSFLIKDLPLP